MKRGWKIFWITCGVMTIIGLACCSIAAGLGVTTAMVRKSFPHGIGIAGNWDDGEDSWDEEHGETSNQVSAEDSTNSFADVRKIDAELFAGKVEIAAADSGDEITVETRGISSELGFKCYQEGEALVLTTRKNLLGINNVGIGTITIRIPRDRMLEEVSLDIGAGTLHIEDLQADSISVSVGAGQAVVDSFTAQEADFDCGAGEITASGDVGKELDMDCATGQMTFDAKGRESDYNYEIECGVGEVIYGEHRVSGLGKSQYADNGAGKAINIDCGVGSVTINFTE